MFLPLFTINQRYGCLRCMKTLAITRTKMVVSVVQSIVFLCLRQVKKSVVSAEFSPLRDILVLKHVLKAGKIEWIEYD